MLSFSQKVFLWHQTSSCKCSMCLHCLCKVSDGFSKSSGTSWFPRACTIWALTKPLLRNKVLKKWLTSKRYHFVKKYFYGIKLLHSNVQFVYIVHAKYQIASVKALVQVDFPMHALKNPYLEAKCQKMAKFKTVILSKYILWHQTSSCKCPMCLQFVRKVSNHISASCGKSWIPCTCTI